MIEKLNIKNDRGLGLYISERRISFALVKRNLRDLRLVKAGSIPTPEGAIADGCVRDAGLLGKAIKSLLDKHHIRHRQAYISLPARPVISQIVDLPKYVPSNLAKFVQSEIRHSAAVSGKEAQYDFCGLGFGPGGASERIFVGATDRDKINALLKACTPAKVEPISIELSPIATLRALYRKRIAAATGMTSLVVMVGTSTLTLCVVRKGVLDFIRSVDLSEVSGDADAFLDRCRGEIETVIQYYELEVDPQSDIKWNLVVETESRALSQEQAEALAGGRSNIAVHLSSDASLYRDTDLRESKSIESASITAIGLAIKDIDPTALNISINLLPPEAKEINAAKKYCLVTANIAAIVLLAMFITGGLIRMQLDQTEKRLEAAKTGSASGSIETVLSRQRDLSSRIESLEAQVKGMGETYEDGNIAMWTDLLEEIRKNTPKSLCIIHLVSPDNQKLSLSGYGLSYKSIHLFADLLRESAFIESAMVTETNKSAQFEGYVTYSIDCVLRNPAAEPVSEEDASDAS